MNSFYAVRTLNAQQTIYAQGYSFFFLFLFFFYSCNFYSDWADVVIKDSFSNGLKSWIKRM